MPNKILLLLVLGAGSLLMAKPEAPVKIVGTMGESSGSVKITFEKAADAVEVQVWGTDGLAIQGNKVQSTKETYAAGETLEFKVDYAPDPKHRNLVVSVHGQFDGSKAARVASFTVGDKTPPSRHTATPATNGARVIEMRGESKK